MITEQQQISGLIFYDLFQNLKEKGASLSWSHYEDFMHCFTLGLATDEEKLKNLLIALWIPRKKYLAAFEELFPAAWQRLQSLLVAKREGSTPTGPSAPAETDSRPLEPPSSAAEITPPAQKSAAQRPTTDVPKEVPLPEGEEWGEVEVNFGESGPSGGHVPADRALPDALKTPFLFSANKTIPFNERKAQQSWRRLKFQYHSALTTQIDIDATIRQLAKQHFIHDFCYKKEKVSQQHFILLIDDAEEMNPYQQMGLQLIKSIKESARLSSVSSFYFNKYPTGNSQKQFRLFTSPEHMQSVPLSKLQSQWAKSAIVLLFSDGGAIEQGFDGERVAGIQDFIAQLKKANHRILWFNPLPQQHWSGTSAEYLATQVPMIALNQAGILKAVKWLKG